MSLFGSISDKDNCSSAKHTWETSRPNRQKAKLPPATTSEDIVHNVLTRIELEKVQLALSSVSDRSIIHKLPLSATQTELFRNKTVYYALTISLI